ncbi:lipolysis-stimulated lipoprotein receptor-like isoform X2 [Entelurus aequoreus]|uniref:lipolysis-stimulated lipoprotein receptor-like isoform X2 n=1 Tax=Entelurus aequoreus TaxID=161455 RepID=UPI002B1DC08D|nr:lipolysis-stimulated lipoprotein receptor-like isoform X2 [Entelurus aequoreus]
MKRKRKDRPNFHLDEIGLDSSEWNMFWMGKCWMLIVVLAGVLPQPGGGVHVFVREQKKYAVLFQVAVLPCQYTSVSVRTPVVQWVYKSYCRDTTPDSFSVQDGPSGGVGGGGGGVTWANGATYLDCADSSRTVRTVASLLGSSVTLAEYYKDRDISIINKADLRIADVQWGDSGVYICQVVIADDLEGENEASVELLVLGLSGVPGDLLPGFEWKIMPEWVFVCAVVVGSVLLLLLVGVCWCQCCPHSCCCYVSCCCCPDTCCCPRHLYEAGKGIKTQTPAFTPAFTPYFVSGVPAMVPIAPPSLVPIAPPSLVPIAPPSLVPIAPPSLVPIAPPSLVPIAPPSLVPIAPPSLVDNITPSNGSLLSAGPVQAAGASCHQDQQDSLRVLQYVENQLAHFSPARSSSHQSCAQSELSSLHEGDTTLHHNLRHVHKKTLPVRDERPQPEARRYRDDTPSSPRRYHDDTPSSPRRYHDDTPSSLRRYLDDAPSSPRRYHDDTPSSPRRHPEHPESEPRHNVEDVTPPRRYSDDPPPSSTSRRHGRNHQQHSHSDDYPHLRWNPGSEHLHRWNPGSEHLHRWNPGSEHLHRWNPGSEHLHRWNPGSEHLHRWNPGSEHLHRWNPGSEHLHRKEYQGAGRRSVEELGSRREHEDHGTELEEFSRHPSSPHAPPPLRCYDDHQQPGDFGDERHRRHRKTERDISPLPSPTKRRGTWGAERSAPPPADDDGTFLKRLLERKATLRGADHGRSQDLDTPSKRSGEESGPRRSRLPSNRPEADTADRPSPRCTLTPSPLTPSPLTPSPLTRREGGRDKSRKVVRFSCVQNED